MKVYAKSIAALLGVLSTWGMTAFEDGSASAGEWWGLVGAVGTVIGVWFVPNKQEPQTTGRRRRSGR